MTKPQDNENSGIFAVILNQPYLLLVLAPLFWGGNLVVAKLVVGEIDPFLLLAARCVLATLFILPFAWRNLQRDWAAVKRHWFILMVYGAVGYAAFNGLLYLGLQTTSGVNAAIVQGSLPMLILACNFLIFHVRVRPLQIVGVLLAITGVLLTATYGELGRILTLDFNIGDVFVIFACFAYTAYTLALRFRPKIDLMSFMAVSFSGAAITAVIMLFVFRDGVAEIASLGHASLGAWLVIGYVAIFPSMFSQIAYARGVELVGANRAAPSHNLIPVFGTLGSILILGEAFHGYHFIAAATIIAGIVLAEWAARRKALA